METTQALTQRPTNSPLFWIKLGIAAIIWAVAYLNVETLSGFIAYTALGLDPATRIGSAVGFFLEDVPKILLLLAVIVFLVGIIRSFFTPERARKALGGKREGVGNVLAASLGIVTPFCSCSAVPLFLGFIESGVPLGVTFSFLISAPMVNEVALALLFGMFGWRVAALYIATGLAVAIFSGWVIGQLKLERWVAEWVYAISVGTSQGLEDRQSWTDRAKYAIQAVREIVGSVWMYVLVGIAVGAAIHGYVPEDFMAGIMGKNVWWSVPAAVIVGVPMYSNAAGIIPVVQALIEKGASLGTVLAFMMSVIALSLPEVIILRRVLKWQLIAVFLSVVGTGIVLVGYLFNAVL